MSDKNTPSEQEPPSNQHSDLPPLAKRFLWADSNSAVERVIFWLGVVCVVLFVLDFIVHRHAYAPGEGIPGFYAIVGFVAFTMIVLGASQLRRIILRNERYYSPNSIDAESYPETGLERLNHGSESLVPGSGDTEEDVATASDVDIGSPIQNDSDRGGSS